MSQEEFSTDEFQYLVNEMGRILEEKLSPLKRRLDRVEEKARRKQTTPSREIELSSSRRHYSRRDTYQDSYSTRLSRPREENFESKITRDERERTSYSSYASKKSFPKDCSRRNGREAYENIFSFFEPKDYLFDSFVSSAHCSEKEKEIKIVSGKENEEKKIEKESEIEERNESVKETSVMEKEIEIEKGCEKEKEIKKEIEIEQKCEEKEKIEKERKDNELEKQTREKEAKEQEKVRNLFTKPHENLSCFVSSFQVSRRPSDDNFQLQYLSKERRFILAEKGNVLNDPSLPMPKGKQGMNVENFKALLPYSIVDGHTVDDLVFRKNLNFDVAICHSLIDDDPFVLSNDKKILAFEKYHFDGIGCLSLTCNGMHVLDAQDESPYKMFILTDHVEKEWKCIDEYAIGKIFDEERINQHQQNLELCDQKLTYHLLGCVDHVDYLIFGVKFPCFCKSFRMKFKGFACLNLSMLTPSLFNLCKLLEIKGLFLPFGSSSQNHVFNPGVCYYESSMKESKHRKICLNECVNNLCLYDTLSLSLKMSHVNLVGLLSQNQNFVFGGCSQLWTKRSEHVLNDNDFELLSALSMKSVMKLPNQIEMARENFVFDPGEHHSISLPKVIEPWKVDFQNHSYQMPCDLCLFPSKKKVRTISIFDPGIGLFVQTVNQISKSSFVFNLHRVTNSFYSFKGDNVKWYPPKEGGHANELLLIRVNCGFQNLQ